MINFYSNKSDILGIIFIKTFNRDIVLTFIKKNENIFYIKHEFTKIDHYLYKYYYINKHISQVDDRLFFLIKVTVTDK